MLNQDTNSKLSSKNTGNGEIPKSRPMVLYGRLSREKNEGTNDVSMDNQVSLGRKYAQLNGLEIIGTFTEIQSGKSIKNRPEFLKAIELAKEEKAVLFLYSLSRGFRSTSNALDVSADLEKNGADLVSFTEKIETQTPSGRLFFTICSAFNSYEREILVERTKSAMDHKRSKKEHLGGIAPYGFRIGKDGVKLFPKKNEQKVISLMMKNRRDGKTYNAIADHLNSTKVPSKTGRKWSQKVVRGIIIRHEQSHSE